MQDHADTTPAATSPQPRMGWLKLTGIILLATVIATAAAVWVVSYLLFPGEFSPVTLSVREEKRLDEKLQRLEHLGESHKRASSPSAPLQPERYSEADATRTLELSERELNALLAKNTDLARKLAIDLSENLASAKLLIPLEEDFPILGGKTIRVTAGVELAYAEGRPVVVLKGVSVWGTPIPNAWLGNLKNVDLIREFGGQEGFWKSFAAGVDHIRVEEGRLQIRLKE